MDTVKITFPDGKSKTYPKGVRPQDIIEEIGSQSLRRKAIVAKVNDRLVDLNRPITEDATLRLITYDDPEGLETYWHSTSHIMAHAVKELFPEAQFGVGPAIENGFYYDIDV
ncbi:MAG: TGS domain-containing protein, partial [Calditrichaeota bacterium]